MYYGGRTLIKLNINIIGQGKFVVSPFDNADCKGLQQLRQVLQCLKDNQLYARLSKCTFFTNSIAYLGRIVDGEGPRPNPQLVQALMDFPQPRTLKELQSFLGLANYYRKFIANFSHIALPLTDTTQSNMQGNLRPIEWMESMQTAFDALKEALTSASCLALPDPNGEFEVTTDASEDTKTVGAVLTQWHMSQQS